MVQQFIEHTYLPHQELLQLVLLVIMEILLITLSLLAVVQEEIILVVAVAPAVFYLIIQIFQHH
jgi:hypothetical protein